MLHQMTNISTSNVCVYKRVCSGWACLLIILLLAFKSVKLQCRKKLLITLIIHTHTRIPRDTHALHLGIFSLNVWLTSRAGRRSPYLGPHCNEVRGKRLFQWGDRVLSEHTSCIVSRKDGGAKGAFRLKEDSVSTSAAFNRCDSLSRVTLKKRK